MGSPRSTIAKSAAGNAASPNGRDGAVLVVVPIDLLQPNPWNPNEMDQAMFQKELASIRKYGFVDPLTVRSGNEKGSFSPVYEIIDGEHRLKAAREVGYADLPCWNLGIVDDATAEELTVILNETRGKSNEAKLRTLLQDLVTRRGGEDAVRDIMPFSRARFDEIIGRMSVDWGALEERREALQEQGRWKELVFRVPRDAAATIEDAIDTVKEREGFEHPWQALEMICRDHES